MHEQLNEDGAYINQHELVLKVNGEPFSISINDLSLKENTINIIRWQRVFQQE